MAEGGHGDPSLIHHAKVAMGLDGGQIERIQGPPIDAMEWTGASLPFLCPGRCSRSSSSPRTSTSSSSKSKVWGRKMTVGAGIAVQEDGYCLTMRLYFGSISYLLTSLQHQDEGNRAGVFSVSRDF